MGLTVSMLSLTGFVKRLTQWYAQINGNLFAYFKLWYKHKNGYFSNNRFKLYDLNKFNDPRHLSLIPFDEEWKLECLSKRHPENLFIYGANSDCQMIVLQITWQPFDEHLVQAKARLTVKETENILSFEQQVTLPIEGLLDQYGHISSFRIGGLLVQISHPFNRLRICYRGFLTNTNNDEIVFSRLNLLWASLGNVFDFQNDYNKYFMMQQFAAQGHTEINRENRFEQWGQWKGTIKLEDQQQRHIYLWGLKAKYSPLDEHFRCTRIMACSIKGIGFNVGSVHAKEVGFKYGYVNMGTGHNRAISSINLEPNVIDNIDKHDKVELELEIGDQGKTIKAIIEPPFEEISENIWLCTLYINSHKSVGLILKENSQNMKIDPQLSPRVNIPFVGMHQPDEGDKYVLAINNKFCVNKSLTGGKGSSLGILYQFSKAHSLKFTVPNGVVVTTKAYGLMLQQNETLQQQIVLFEEFVRKNTDPTAVRNQCDQLQAEFKKCTLPAILCLEIKDKLSELFSDFEQGGKMFAVRSSAVEEDCAEMSTAGQMSTFLGMSTLSAIVHSVVKCWASQFSHTAIEYKRGYGQPLNSPMAVVVQQMVHCDKAGVIFTCDPITGNERYLSIAANLGLGESVVGSLSEPDTIQVEVKIETNVDEGTRQFKDIRQVTIGSKAKCVVVNKDLNCVQEEDVDLSKRQLCCLTDQEVAFLSNLSLAIRHHYEDVRDIEWGIKGDHVYIFQSRPVTNLDGLTEWEIMHEMDTGQNSEREAFSRANLGEVFPGASSYICLSWLLSFWKAFGHKRWKYIGNLNDQDYVPYFNTGFGVACNTAFFILKSVAFAFGGDSKSTFTQGLQLGMFGHKIDEEQIWIDSREKLSQRNQSLLAKLISAVRFIGMMVSAGRNNQKAQQQFGKFKLEVEHENDASKLFHILGHQVDSAFEPYANHVTVTMASMMYNALLFNFICSNTGKDNNENQCLEHFSQIVSSAQNIVSAKVPLILNEIARSIEDKPHFVCMDDENAHHYLLTSNDKAAVRFRTFLLEYGHRGYKEFDPYSKQWEDNPTTLIHSLKAMISKENDHLDNKILEKSDADMSLPFVKQLLLDYLFTPLSQHGIRIREQGKDLLTKSLHQYRKIFWQLADKLTEDGRIPDPELLFFMTFSELGRLVERPNATTVANAKARKRLHLQKERLKFNETAFGPEMNPRNIKQEKGSDEYSGVRRLKGVPVSSGKIIARCCVAVTLDEAKQIEKGDILVTFSTDIGWSPYFVALSGLVTEIGGLISHGAVIAREYGLPCLVGVQNATQTFQSGDIVMLDTESGEVVKLDHIQSSKLDTV